MPYESRPFETLFPAATERQKEMLGWILANTYPAISADATFELAGVDAAASPVLDKNDAYASVQIALWVLLGQIDLDEVYFLDCTSGETHPKSDRMRTAVLEILRLAGEYVDSEPELPVLSPLSKPGCCGDRSVMNCCNRSTLSAERGAPYFVFQGCPDEVRTVCGRLLIGPFRVLSSFSGQPKVTVTPFCSCGEDYSVVFMDFCGNPISNPVIGQEFYLALRTCSKFVCFTVTASFSGTITRVVTMEAQSTALNYQPIGTSFDDVQVNLQAEVCVCVEYPVPDCYTSQEERGPQGQLGININNNNNNNNNNNLSNIYGGGTNGYPLSFSCIIPCYPGWGHGLYPPYPLCPSKPYPPYPPCQPESYPPESPYPPYPPYPPNPCSPKPCPPEPPYPPNPCLSKPCSPEPPCPPKPCPPCSLCPPRPCLPCPPKLCSTCPSKQSCQPEHFGKQEHYRQPCSPKNTPL